MGGREKVGVQSRVCGEAECGRWGPDRPADPPAEQRERGGWVSPGRQRSDGLPSDPPHLYEPSRLPKRSVYLGSSHPCLLSYKLRLRMCSNI